MKLISLFAAILFSPIAFAEGPSIGFGKERSPVVSPEVVSPVDQKPESTNTLDPIRMLFDELKAKYEKDSALAVKPVAEGYLRKLALLEKQLADNRRFDDAEIVKKYADYIKAKYIDMAMDVPMPDIDKIKELVELEKQFRIYSTKAIKPVADAYVNELDVESVKCAKNKDYKSAKMFQEEIADIKSSNFQAQSSMQSREVILTQNVRMELCYCPAGTFMMGSPADEVGRNNDETQHQVTLTNRFWMGRTEVTQAQWQAVMGNNPSDFKGNNLPVEMVTGNAALLFCKKLTQYEAKRIPNGYEYRLPTEAEWEYACRAGSTGPYPYAGNGNLDDLGWYKVNSEDRTHPVGQKKPNAWGLHDMLGNVREWCQDSYSAYPVDAVINPIGPGMDALRVIRGGTWSNKIVHRAACREGGGNSPVAQCSDLGFRVVLAPIIYKR